MSISVEELKNALKAEGIRADLVTLGAGDGESEGQDDATIEDFAAGLKLPRSRVLKTVTFVHAGKESEWQRFPPVLVVLRNSDRVNLAALEARLEGKLRLAKASEVREITGCKIGNVSPFGVTGVVVVIDEGIGEGDVMLPAGSERFRAYLNVSFKDVARLVLRLNPEPVPVVFRVSETAQKQ